MKQAIIDAGWLIVFIAVTFYGAHFLVKWCAP